MIPLGRFSIVSQTMKPNLLSELLELFLGIVLSRIGLPSLNKHYGTC